MPDLAVDVVMGMVTAQTPELWSTSNFSPMPVMAPPPLGRVIDGALGKTEAADSAGRLKKPPRAPPVDPVVIREDSWPAGPPRPAGFPDDGFAILRSDVDIFSTTKAQLLQDKGLKRS
jgi:hypothetical protein